MLDVVFIVSFDDGRVWHRRVQIERHIECLCTFKNRPETLIVKEDTVGQPVHHPTLEAKPGDCSFKFVGRSLRVWGRQHREGCKAIGMGAHRFGEAVVSRSRQPHRKLRIGNLLHRRGAVRQHLDIDPGSIHFGDPAVPDIIETLGKRDHRFGPRQ